MNMNNALKILIGIIVLLIGAWTMIDPAWVGQSGWVYGLNWWHNTWDLIKGSFGPVLIFIGIIVIWITYEETKS
jgi:hypothetical protein